MIKDSFNSFLSKVKNMATETQKKVKAAFNELKKNPPAVLKKTAKKKGSAAANKQRIAIALSKTRAKGAKVPTRQDVLARIKERSRTG